MHFDPLNISECAPVVTVGTTGGGVFVQTPFVTANTSFDFVAVRIIGRDFTPVDSDFHLVMVC